MIQYFPTITGSLTVNGDLIVTGTGSMSASLALNSNLLQGTGSTGFATTASLTEVSSSQQQISASLLTLTASYAALSSSYTALSGSYTTFSGSASTRVTQIENTYATTGSNSFRANQSITGSLVVSSTITAQTLVVQTVTSSIVYSSGSNLFGSALGDRQTFTGSVNITGSQTVFGKVGIDATSSYAKFNISTGDDNQMALGTTNTGQTIGIYLADGPTTSSAGYKWEFGKTSANNFFIYSYGTAANALSIAYSTGATTFSGDLSVVTTGSTTALIDGTNPTLTLRRNNNGNASAAINFKGSSAVKWQIGTNQATGLGFEVNEGDATANKFYIAPGGAASFASSLYAASVISSGTSISAATYVSAPSGFYTTSNNNAIPFTTWTTLTTVDSNVIGLYLVVIGLTSQLLTDWAATGILYSSGAYASWIVGPTNGSLVQLRISGTNIQVYQNGGSPSQNLSYKLLKIA